MSSIDIWFAINFSGSGSRFRSDKQSVWRTAYAHVHFLCASFAQFTTRAREVVPRTIESSTTTTRFRHHFLDQIT